VGTETINMHFLNWTNYKTAQRETSLTKIEYLNSSGIHSENISPDP